jgi:hypothetical protein
MNDTSEADALLADLGRMIEKTRESLPDTVCRKASVQS